MTVKVSVMQRTSERAISIHEDRDLPSVNRVLCENKSRVPDSEE